MKKNRNHNTDGASCIYCLQNKPVSEFTREHVFPQAFGKFEGSLVLHQVVCKGCNQLFGDTIDNSLARGSLQGALRYLRGIKPLNKFADTNKTRITLKARGPNDSKFRDAEFVSDSEGTGLAFVPGLSFTSVSQKREIFISLQDLESAKWNEPTDINRLEPVTVSYASPEILERIKFALAKLKLGLEILDDVSKIEARQGVLVAVDAIVDDVSLRRAIAKISFNYLAYIRGKEFALDVMFNDIRSFIISNHPLPSPVTVNPQIELHRDGIRKVRNLGYMVGLELAADNTTLVGFVQFNRLINYRVNLGSFPKLSIPISCAHLYEIPSMKVIQLTATRPLSKLWIPH
jgi:hypothetical protein